MTFLSLLSDVVLEIVQRLDLADAISLVSVRRSPTITYFIYYFRKTCTILRQYLSEKYFWLPALTGPVNFKCIPSQCRSARTSRSSR
jgi:hypothetical protein